MEKEVYLEDRGQDLICFRLVKIKEGLWRVCDVHIRAMRRLYLGCHVEESCLKAGSKMTLLNMERDEKYVIQYPVKGIRKLQHSN